MDGPDSTTTSALELVEDEHHPAEGERDPFDIVAKVISGVVVALCCIYVVWMVHPDLVLRNTTPTGGDMGAHVWGPAYLRDELLPHLRVAGWTTDWYAGFPAYSFYMVVPSLFIVALDVGVVSPTSIFGAVLCIAIVALAGLAAWRLRLNTSRLARFVGWAACLLVPIFLIDIPYNVAFKIVAVSGVVAFPAAVWYLLSGLSLRRPGPELGAIASVAFLADQTLFHIYGGNLASTMAGEFAFSISLTLSLFALGAIARGVRTGGYRVRASILIAVAMLCHVIPGAFFLVVGAVLIVALRPRWSSIKWALPVGVSGGLMALWWYLPFYGRSDFLNDMGWEKLGVELDGQPWARTQVASALRGLGATVADSGSCAYQTVSTNWDQMWRYLLPFAPHKIGGGVFDDPDMWAGKVFFVLAGVGVVLSIVMVVRSGIWLTLMTLIAGVAFIVMPQDRFWNARVLPFYYLGIYLLAAVGLALLLRSIVLVVTGRWGDLPLAASAGILVVVMCVLSGALGMTFRTNPGGKNIGANGAGKQQYSWLWFTSTYQGVVRDWAKWNFEGLEEKPGWSTAPVDANNPTGPQKAVLDTSNSSEFFGMIKEMQRVGKTDGCGRAFWEYDDRLNNYGTPMAPMLLPYYTNHCIGSMEGLYFEASSTTPFHFLVQSELSQKPSRPERFDCHLGFETSPYRDYDIAEGVSHLQMLGVKYYMAVTEASKQAAATDPRLTEVGSSGPWKVYEVADIDLVSPLENDPVVWTDVKDDIYDWARPAVDWFNDPKQWSVLGASDGPKDWPRASSKSAAKATPAAVQGVKVSNVKTETDSISFDVNKTGAPVLIRTSYFPNWDADGADGVYRVTPNFMVVVPTSKHVTLTYGRSGLEYLAFLLSAVGALMVLWFLLRPFPAITTSGDYFGDRTPVGPPDPEPDTEPDAETDWTESLGPEPTPASDLEQAPASDLEPDPIASAEPASGLPPTSDVEPDPPAE